MKWFLAKTILEKGGNRRRRYIKKHSGKGTIVQFLLNAWNGAGFGLADIQACIGRWDSGVSELNDNFVLLLNES